MASVSCILQGASATLSSVSQSCSLSKMGSQTFALPAHKGFLGQCSQLATPQAPSRSGRQGHRGTPVAKVREIFMPALSSTMTEGKIVSWLKGEGDKVSKGDSVVVVESDKADMDVETFYDGYLAALVVEEGEVAPVGSPIGLLADTEEEINEAKEKAKGLSGGSAPAAPTPEPEAEAPPPPPPAPTADMAAPPPPAPAAAAAAPTAPPPPPAAPAAASSGRIVATPYAKKLAKKYKIELTRVTGTGNFGRITADDVEKAVNGPSAPAAAPAAAPAPAAPAVAAASAAPVKAAAPTPAPAASAPLGTTVPFTGMQSAVANNMNASLTVPLFRVGYTITTDALDALYKQIKSKGVTMTALLAKATALALAKHPVVNAACKDGKSFTYNSSINISCAVSIDGGLITPVLQNADKVDIYTLSRTWAELVGKARSKSLSPAEYNTGTFTLSNLGMFGVDRFDAILPPGQGAIMAVGASKPVVVATADGMFGVKKQMQVNVTADHRIIYGADLAAFLKDLAAIIENPKDLVL